jgi:hypothetical protein
VSDRSSGRPLAERPSSQAPGGRPAPRDVDLAAEVAALAALLADVVQIAQSSAIFPGQWAELAELALEHASVRAALQAERTESGHVQY